MKMVWSFQCVLLSWSLVVFFLPSFSTGQACTTKGWFGTNCQYKCHCTNDNCNFTTGECLDSSVCVQGWFGPQCQYVDLITAFHNSNNPMWLYDGDDSTCNNDTTLQTVTVQLTGPEPFTWLRLHVRNKDELTTIEVQFKSDSSRLNNLVDCNNKRTAGVGNNSLDIHCDLDIYVQQVILTGQGVRSLCSVYFSGGRLVTLRQNTAQSTTSNFKFASKAVDGIDSYEDCSSTQREQNPHWTVTFSNPQAMNILSVNYLETPFSTYTVTWYHNLSKLQKRTLYSQKNSITSNARYMSTAIHPVAPVTRITISFTVPDSQRLELCEVAAYGDTVCPQGKYGRECEHNCDNCFNQTCFVSTGGCPDGCIDGYMGDQCQTPCQPNTYGQDCLQTCSTNCVRNETLTDQVCHHVDGSCILGCKDGFIGPLCEDRGQGEDSFPISAVVGAVAAVVLIIAVIVAVLLWRRRKRNKDDKSIYMNENTPAAADTNNRTSTE